MKLQCICGSVNNFKYTRLNINTNDIDVETDEYGLQLVCNTNIFNSIWDVLQIQCNDCFKIYEISNGEVMNEYDFFKKELVELSGLAIVE